MKKSSIAVIVLVCMCFILIATSIVKAEDAESAVNQLNGELQRSGVVTRDEASAIKSPLKNMVERGASKRDLQNTVTQLSNNGVRGNDLQESVRSMNSLVNSGTNTREAGNLVSQAAAQAHADGLKGKDLAAKVHEAVKEMQAEKRAAVEARRAQNGAGNAGGGMGQGVGSSNSSAGGQGRGMGNMGGGHGGGMGNMGGHGRGK